LVFPPSISPAAESLNGHDWKEMSKNTKATFILGFISGYMKGRWEGITGKEGMLEGLRFVDEVVCKDKKESVCTRVRDVRAGKAEMNATLTVIGFKESNLYYVGELDAFYEAFPLCRGKAVSSILDQLIGLWASPRFREEISSYEKIGANCGMGG
jgi:hypothetical protein